MRGKERQLVELFPLLGITPAYAGKSMKKSLQLKPWRDHPRVCGEKESLHSVPVVRVGSPPRMRGKAFAASAAFARARITPAYAGKRGTFLLNYGGARDHPRVCGEKIRKAAKAANQRGSPPRMRGKAAFHSRFPALAGITPAYAGKRLKRSHRIGHFSCILCLFHSVLHRASASGGSRAGPCAPPCLPAQNAVPV